MIEFRNLWLIIQEYPSIFPIRQQDHFDLPKPGKVFLDLDELVLIERSLNLEGL